MKYRKPFTVFPRKMKSGKVIWYYQTYDNSGKRTSAYSTGQTTKSAARSICFKLLKQEKLVPMRVGMSLPNISFHSWRHYFNTIMRSNNISDSKLQRMTGHKSLQMTDHYTHYGLDDLKEIGDIQAKIIPFSNAG